ncbi:coiled-coil domain-containing protein 162-like [Echeneis naucrates]|uniref:coiled-coil domain-containing protein 162-like n=1 Tax=Echeneis naucrates TaxID=173247 RepID=UPI0011137C23|nr:coiled-coil domain-containing protein 162-like [Echeneis naucrates]
MSTALPLLSDVIQTDGFSLMLPVPRPLEAQSCQAQRMYPWRSFLACYGLFPLRVWNMPNIEYCMQLCLSGLSDCSRLQANAADLGVSLLMGDVLNSGTDAQPVRLHGNKDDLCDGKPDYMDRRFLEAEAEEMTTSAPPQEPVRVQSVLKGFLLLTKQFQVFKESWAQRRLGPEVFTMPRLYQQFVKLYRAEIFYPSMKALAQNMGKDRDYEVLMSGSKSLLPPPGASEVDVKTWQLHRLLESTECDMIKAAQRKISGEMTLVLSERIQQDTCLPTELWKKSPLKFSLSPEWPQTVETFIQQLKEGAEQVEGQLRISPDRLRQCAAQLGSSLMEQERRNFLFYSHFYEQLLQQQIQLLYQKEQDLKSLKDAQRSSCHTEVAGFCRGMMKDISGLQARVAHLEEQKLSLEEELGLRLKERYDPLVRQLFSTCIQLKARLDQYRRQMEQDVSETVNRIRAEGVDRIMSLRKNHGCSKQNDGLALMQLKKEEVQQLELENSRLAALLCKLKALSRWRQVVDQEKLHRRLLHTQQREISSRTEALRVKMIAKEDVVILQGELDAARQALTCCQAECSRTKKLLSRKTEELQAARYQSAQEACSRRELDTHRVQSLEQMKVDMEDRDRRLQALGEQLDRGSRMIELQRQRSAKHIQQVRSQLHHERCLKQEAFQQVAKLKHRLEDTEAVFSKCSSTTGLGRDSRQQSSLQLGGLTQHTTPQDFSTEPRHRRAETAHNTTIHRPKAETSRLRVLAAHMLFPEL